MTVRGTHGEVVRFAYYKLAGGAQIVASSMATAECTISSGEGAAAGSNDEAAHGVSALDAGAAGSCVLTIEEQ